MKSNTSASSKKRYSQSGCNSFRLVDEARAMLDRYSEWRVLQAALTNPCEEVRELATTHLHEFAEAGDPFSQAILAGREIP